MPTYKANMPKGNVAGQVAGLAGRAMTRAPAVSAKQSNKQTLPNSQFPSRDVVDRVNAALAKRQGRPVKKKGK